MAGNTRLSRRLATIWSGNRALIAALAVAALFTLFFAVRFAVSTLHWHAGGDPALAPWMTLGYVARSHDVPRDALRPLAGVADPEGRRLTLEEIARLRGIPTETLILEIRSVIAAQRAGVAQP